MTAGKGLAQIRPPFARGVRKDGLTVYEKTLLTIANLADSVVNTLGQKSKLGATIKKRAGMLTLSADTTSVDKFLFMRGQQMQKTQISAKSLWDNFHFIESFAEITDTATGKIIHNQHVLQTGEKIPFCLDDWNKLLNNNKFNTVNGQTGEIISIDWDFQQGIANISYKIKQLYTKNIILVFNDGQ